MNNSDQKTVLVTGGARRIGASICRTLHASGLNVLIHTNQSIEEANNLAGELNKTRPNSAKSMQHNLATIQDTNSFVNDCLNVFGQIDYVVCNASRFYPTVIGEVTSETWDDLFTSNVQGHYFLIQALAPELKSRNGAIVNIIDVNIERPLADHSIYLMAKAAAAMMTKSLAKELAPNVRVNGISPGAIIWPENDGFTDETAAERLKQIPLGRVGEPSDIANLAEALLLESPYITGQIISVDGGRTLS